MPHKYIFFIFTLLSASLFGQSPATITESIAVTGMVDSMITFTRKDIGREKIYDIGDLSITNHLGEHKKTYKNLKGVLLLDLLKKVKISASSPKLLSEYYFVLKASDGYTVVFSWNELFNTEIGNSVYVVISEGYKDKALVAEETLLVSMKDIKTGRRHIKWLQTIEVRKA